MNARFFNIIVITLPILLAELFSVSPPMIKFPSRRGVATRQVLTNEVPNKKQQVAQAPHQKLAAIRQAGPAHRGF